MSEIPFFWIHTYTDVDRAFWAEHLEDWLPERIMDAHVHVAHPRFQVATITEETKRSYWVMELQESQDADTAALCYKLLYPDRQTSCICTGAPSLGWEIEGMNADLVGEARRRGWYALAVVRPTWVAAQIEWLLDQPGIIGVKPYYALLGFDRNGRDLYQEASIFDFLPPHQLEVLDARSAWVTLHVPRAGRLGHPENIREVKELRRRYPRIRLVIAHLGRCYTLPHAEEAFPYLADDPGLYFDNSAVLNPAVHRLALQLFGAERILYGTDNPVFYLRGRRQWHDRTYINRTNYPFYFNTERESPEIEAAYTLMMYEALKAIKEACADLGLGREAVESVFFRNAERLLDGVNRKG